MVDCVAPISMTDTKTGRELEGTHGYKGPKFARRILAKLGFHQSPNDERDD